MKTVESYSRASYRLERLEMVQRERLKRVRYHMRRSALRNAILRKNVSLQNGFAPLIDYWIGRFRRQARFSNIPYAKRLYVGCQRFDGENYDKLVQWALTNPSPRRKK